MLQWGEGGGGERRVSSSGGRHVSVRFLWLSPDIPWSCLPGFLLHNPVAPGDAVAPRSEENVTAR